MTTVMSERALTRVLSPLIALAAGSLLGGAFFHVLDARLTVLSEVA